MRPRLRFAVTAVSALLLAAASLAGAGCSAAGPQPALDSREALGTVVSVTAYPADDSDADKVRGAVDLAYEKMAQVEGALDAHDPSSAISRINSSGGGTLPPEAVEVLKAREALGVSAQFSPFLLEVVALYDFEGEQTVPADAELAACLASTRAWLVQGERVDFVPAMLSSSDPGPSGMDFGGAAKGLALENARRALEDSPLVTAALISSGSTTVTFGDKPDDQPWRIGVEDPRDPDSMIATVEANGAVAVSTSGDYQRYFERDGLRYHHILDPLTGLPARGMRSLTVVGQHTGLDSDVLSTALFVMGPEQAIAYAEERGLGLVVVDDQGRVRVVPGPDDASWRIVETSR